MDSKVYDVTAYSTPHNSISVEVGIAQTLVLSDVEDVIEKLRTLATMSYTPKDQLLQTPLTSLIDNINHVTKVIENRILDQKEWSKEHLQTIYDLQIELYDLRFRLLKLVAEVT